MFFTLKKALCSKNSFTATSCALNWLGNNFRNCLKTKPEFISLKCLILSILALPYFSLDVNIK